MVFAVAIPTNDVHGDPTEPNQHIFHVDSCKPKITKEAGCHRHEIMNVLVSSSWETLTSLPQVTSSQVTVVYLFDVCYKKVKFLPIPGIEPGPSGWEPDIVTTRLYGMNCSLTRKVKITTMSFPHLRRRTLHNVRNHRNDEHVTSSSEFHVDEVIHPRAKREAFSGSKDWQSSESTPDAEKSLLMPASQTERSCGLMDKALDFGSRDWGFESLHDHKTLFIFFSSWNLHVYRIAW